MVWGVLIEAMVHWWDCELLMESVRKKVWCEKERERERTEVSFE